MQRTQGQFLACMSEGNSRSRESEAFSGLCRHLHSGVHGHTYANVIIGLDARSEAASDCRGELRIRIVCILKEDGNWFRSSQRQYESLEGKSSDYPEKPSRAHVLNGEGFLQVSAELTFLPSGKPTTLRPRWGPWRGCDSSSRWVCSGKESHVCYCVTEKVGSRHHLKALRGNWATLGVWERTAATQRWA